MPVIGARHGASIATIAQRLRGRCVTATPTQQFIRLAGPQLTCRAALHRICLGTLGAPSTEANTQG
jgi:hypothetical protein